MLKQVYATLNDLLTIIAKSDMDICVNVYVSTIIFEKSSFDIIFLLI